MSSQKRVSNRQDKKEDKPCRMISLRHTGPNDKSLSVLFPIAQAGAPLIKAKVIPATTNTSHHQTLKTSLSAPPAPPPPPV